MPRQHQDCIAGIPKASPHPYAASKATHRMQRVQNQEYRYSPCDNQINGASFPSIDIVDLSHASRSLFGLLLPLRYQIIFTLD